MKLKSVEILKYKSIENTQTFEVEDDVTVLVGMNESGKTSVLEAIAKTNYFQNDKKFKFNTTHDYPRKEKKALDKSGRNPEAVVCTYTLADADQATVERELGEGVFVAEPITVSTMYDNEQSWALGAVDRKKFIELKTEKAGINSNTLTEKLVPVVTLQELNGVIAEYTDEDKRKGLEALRPYYQNVWGWACPVQEYVAREILTPSLPKFLYYDEYYALPSRISINDLEGDALEGDELKTAKALFELADINVKELINADDFEDFIAELEATEATITEELFEYWTTNKNLDITFRIDKKHNANQQIIEHILDIRVKNKRTRVSLPLRNRSKGFNWFFSFLVWFKKVQEDRDSSYVLLLDEPGLNLHASAQADLLRFINDLSEQYQIIYTTHSPFMVQSEQLEKVRTILETENGTQVSDSLHEKDPKTLFPLQAALGYNIAQNLFISTNNLLVEGISDLVYLQVMSSVLEEAGRTSLSGDITIVPTGGLEKVATFISLLRGSELNIACLLDSFSDQKGRQKLENMIQQKLIKEKQVRFAHEFVEGLGRADIEDFFQPDEYLKVFKAAFPEHENLLLADPREKGLPIISRINEATGKPRFNHYRPANWLAKEGVDADFFDAKTLDIFEGVFQEINSLFGQ
jgi:predicted ATPase